MRPRIVVVVLVALAGVLSAVPAGAQVGNDLENGCNQAGGPAGMCRGFYHLSVTAGTVCRHAGGADECANLDGRVIDSKQVDAASNSWLSRALADQRTLDDNLPLQEEFWTHTHNSFDAEAYAPTLYDLDPNQLYSITDQLRMGVRAIEIDLHWVIDHVAVCHGHQIDLMAIVFHLGCGVNDPTPDERFSEIRAWMDKNPKEIVMLYLENQMEGNPTAHDEAAAAIDKAFGPLVYKPPTRCAAMPMDTSRAQIRATGKRIIITGNCGPGTWGSLVFERGPRWIEGGLSYGSDFPPYPCTAERAKDHYDTNWIRHWGDETGISDGAGTIPGQDGGGDVTVEDARNMIRCGVNMIGLDNLRPFDPRLMAQVWSWAPMQPKSGSCAYQGSDGFFYSDNCSTPRPFACLDGTTWVVTGRRGPWWQGAKVCAHFGVPRTGWQNELLRGAKRGGEVWVNYADRGHGFTPAA
jgi:hypothetical protein